MKNLNLIRKIAWSFHYTTGVEFNELFSEASLAYCEALQTFNPNKASLSTYAWHCMKSRLLDFIKMEKRNDHKSILSFMELAEWEKMGNYETGSMKQVIKCEKDQAKDCINEALFTFMNDPFAETFEQWLQKIPEDCRYISKLLINDPDKFINESLEKPKTARGILYRSLREQGWSWPRIWKSYKNMRVALNETPEIGII